jgi:hypothetical protein
MGRISPAALERLFHAPWLCFHGKRGDGMAILLMLHMSSLDYRS